MTKSEVELGNQMTESL